MNKTKILLISMWIALGASIVIVNNQYYTEGIAGVYIIDGILNILNKDYK